MSGIVKHSASQQFGKYYFTDKSSFLSGLPSIFQKRGAGVALSLPKWGEFFLFSSSIFKDQILQ
jgi:hypothetical protein